MGIQSVPALTLTFKPTIAARERILVFGGMGAGKTSNIISVARRCPDDTFRVMDSDDAFGRMLTGDNAALDSVNGGNIVVEPVMEWTDYTRLLDKFQAESRPDDWIVSDFHHTAWDEVQSYFTDRVFGKGIDQFFLEARASQKKGSAFDGRKDWTVINKLYRQWANQLTLKSKCHVYATAGVAAVQEDDGKEIKALYGRYGVKPTGQKETGHRFHTVLWAQRSVKGDFRLNTVKDRERVEMVDVDVEDFASDYLLGVAGWKRAAVTA